MLNANVFFCSNISNIKINKMFETEPKLNNSWEKLLNTELGKQYYTRLKEFICRERKKYEVFPPEKNVFAAFNSTPYHMVKVVILGQDPYHGPGQANGLAFSVNEGIKLPPSLRNIFKEINNDMGLVIPEHGDLAYWSSQGVFLLNSTLTVRRNQPGSHQRQGWEKFTDVVIRKLSENRENLVFLLWGNHAINKESLIDKKKHYILKAAHPSPFSAYKGFFGCRHFSQTNQLLKQLHNKPIDWRL